MSRGTVPTGVKAPGTLMGIAEVEEYLGVPRSTITRWREKGKMPQPRDAPRASPIWDRKDIERFKAERDESRADGVQVEEPAAA